MKKRTNLWQKILWFFLLLFLIANVIIWITDTTYIYKALVYQKPNIDDLDLFEYRVIENKARKEPWKTASDYNKKKLTKRLRQKLEDNESVAFLVVKNDSILYEEYWDGYSAASFSNSFSMAKSIVSILIGIAVDEGKIKSIDDPVGNYLPEFKEGEKAEITIRHVLQMASGLSFQESYSTPFNNTTDAYYGKDLRKLINSLTVREKPGTVSRYKSGDTQLLEMLLVAATGNTLSEYASEKLWSRIGAEHEARWSLDHKNGDEKAYCCFYSNARDFARIGKLYLQGGIWNDSQVVSKEWIIQSLTPNMLLNEDGVKTDNYGLQWWIYTTIEGDKVYYARGILGQYIIMIPKKNMVVVRLGKKRNNEMINNHPTDVITFIEEAVNIFGGHSQVVSLSIK